MLTQEWALARDTTVISILLLHFLSDLDQFYQFVDNITTPGGVGGDTTEDVFGGLDAMLELNWPATGTKVSKIIITGVPKAKIL